MATNDVPDWAKRILREPSTGAELEWADSMIKSATDRLYEIREGIPVFHNEADSYQNVQTQRPAVNRDNPTVRAFEDRETIFDRLADQIRGKVVLDMCSGGGMPSYYLAARYGCWVISVERAYNAIKYYGDMFREYYGISDEQVVRLCADALHLPVKAESVDVVLGSSWIHHFDDKVRVLQEALRTLKPGGLLIAHNEGVASLLNKGTADEDKYTRAHLYKQAMQRAGFVHARVIPCSRLYRIAWWLKGSVDVAGQRPIGSNQP